MVYVLDINGQPLMPTDRHGKVKHLLKFSTMPKGYKTPKLSNCNRIASRKTTLVTQVAV